MRVYLAATARLLQRLLADGGLTGPLVATAVTPALREAYAEGDLEELEYAAALEAARASMRLLADEAHAGSGAVPRRVVVAADVPDTAGTPDASVGRAAVRLAVPVPLDRVAAVHVDEAAAEPAVRAAVGVLDRADAGDEDATFLVDEVEGFDLLWFAPQELPDLVAELERA